MNKSILGLTFGLLCYGAPSVMAAETSAEGALTQQMKENILETCKGKRGAAHGSCVEKEIKAFRNVYRAMESACQASAMLALGSGSERDFHTLMTECLRQHLFGFMKRRDRTDVADQVYQNVSNTFYYCDDYQDAGTPDR